MRFRLVVVSAASAVAVLAVAAAPAFATTYYVSSSGSDSAAGTSPASAWRTVGKVDNQALEPGDSVLFEGGATFSDRTLMPASSGTASAPIRFASYGSGHATIANANGAVWFSGRSWLVFDDLRLTSAGAAATVFGSSASAGSSNITLSDSVLTDTDGIGVNSPSSANANWTISGNEITHTGDSGLIMLGGPHTITKNTVAYTGGNAAITWGKHGIYSKGPDQTISYNDFSYDTNGQAISIRFHGARVFGNTIHDTPAAIAFFDYDTAAPPQGTSYVYGNRVWNISSYGFYYDDYPDPAGHAPTVDFVLASNTFQFASATAEGVNVSRSGSAKVTVVNNVFFGTFGNVLRPASTTVEHHNLSYGGTGWIPSGSGDLKSAPSLTAAPDFAPNPGSPAVDAGTTSVPGLAYANACDGTVLAYCGSAPDLGAVETAVVGGVPLAPPSALVAGGVGQTGLTLTWAASGDPRVGGYDVLRNGSVVGSAALPIATVSGLACGTTYAFAVRATGSGTTSATAATTATTAACAAATSASVPAPSAPASSGGGGGGGGTPPELAVSLAFGPQPTAVGDRFDYAVTLANSSIQSSDRTVLTVALPAGVQYLGASVERGSGCTAAGQTLTCDLDFFPGKLTATVRIAVKVLAATALTATASVWSMPADANPANDRASVTVGLGGAGSPTTLGNYTTPASTSTTTAATTSTVRSLQVVPASNAVVRPRFLVVAKTPASVEAVAFVLDGRSACVDRARPFTCALKARAGWHRVSVRPIGGKASVVRLRVAS